MNCTNAGDLLLQHANRGFAMGYCIKCGETFVQDSENREAKVTNPESVSMYTFKCYKCMRAEKRSKILH